MAKFTISRLETRNGAYVPGMNGVDKITYLRTGYNKGYQFDGAVYMITHDDTAIGEDSDIRKLIPEGYVTSIHVKKEDGEEGSAESEVELPQE